MNYPAHPIEYKPVEGKTYSLMAGSNSPSEYYHTIAEITDNILQQGISADALLKLLRKESARTGRLKVLFNWQDKGRYLPAVDPYRGSLYKYTRAVETHLKGLSVLSFFDRRLSTTERQYHLYMIEIELTNRINQDVFRKCSRKIALLPYCLREFDHACKASQGDFDTECRNCSKTCFTGMVSKLLRSHSIEPYIWMGTRLRDLISAERKNKSTPGILGIACIPELVAGMRKCSSLDLPVMGIPLNANRCIRWTGKFLENSVYLEKLEELIQ